MSRATIKDNKINVCILGYGSIASLHLEAYQDAGITNITIVEPKESQRVKISDSEISVLSKMPLKNKFDLVDICTPTNTHAKLVEFCLQQTDALILCEKPLTRTHEELESLSKIVDIDSRVYCALVERFHQPFKEIHSFIKDDAISSMEFERFCLRPSNRSWLNNKKLSGDVALDLAIHDIDLALWISGMKSKKSSFRNVSDKFTTKLSFVNGKSNISISVGWKSLIEDPSGVENRLTITADNATASYDSFEGKVRLNDKSKLVKSRVPHAYYAEINEAIRLAAIRKVGEDIVSTNLPNISEYSYSSKVLHKLGIA